jgi:hypothetical protein
MTLSTTRSATAERSFYLIVRGGGSWGGGDPFRTYRAGAHEVSAEVAEAVLVFKEKHPKASWLVLSDVRPELEDGSLVSLLLPEHVQPGAMPDGVRLLREDEVPALSQRHIRSMRFRARPGGFWLCEAVRVRVGVDIMLTFCNAYVDGGGWRGTARRRQAGLSAVI